jgi:exosome complex exonuclease RRP6
MHAVKDLRKPQLDFMTEIDNSRQNPFMPRIKSENLKYHATAKLDLKAKKLPPPAEGDEGLVGPQTFFAHPYETELRNLSFPPWCTVNDSRVSATPTCSPHPFFLVETEAGFLRMVEQLHGAKELAVDLEHHHHHTFQGLTCLMQVFICVFFCF